MIEQRRLISKNYYKSSLLQTIENMDRRAAWYYWAFIIFILLISYWLGVSPWIILFVFAMLILLINCIFAVVSMPYIATRAQQRYFFDSLKYVWYKWVGGIAAVAGGGGAISMYAENENVESFFMAIILLLLMAQLYIIRVVVRKRLAQLRFREVDWNDDDSLSERSPLLEHDVEAARIHKVAAMAQNNLLITQRRNSLTTAKYSATLLLWISFVFFCFATISHDTFMYRFSFVFSCLGVGLVAEKGYVFSHLGWSASPT